MGSGGGHGTKGGSEGERAKDQSPARDIDALFQLPLGEFTSARNALAVQLKKGGNTGEAAQVKALPKPSVSAWAVNQLYWRHRQAFDRLMDTGDEFRKAQAAQLAGKSVDVRGPLEARREALSQLAQLAAAILRESDHPATPDMMRRVTSTLEALATYGRAENAPAPGRLTDDIEPPGFETIAALVPRIGRESRGGTEPTRVLSFQQHRAHPPKGKTREEDARREDEERKARLAEAKRAVHDAERALAQAKKTAAKSEAALKDAAARVKETEKERAAAEKVFEKAASAAEAAKQEARRIASEAEEAAQAVEDAERDLEKARREVKTLE